MDDHSLPKRVMSGELESAGKRGPARKEKQRKDYVVKDHLVFGITGESNTAALDLEV